MLLQYSMPNLKAVFDTAGRLIIGVPKENTPDVLINPAFLVVQPTAANKLDVAVYPLLFNEVRVGDDPLEWKISASCELCSELKLNSDIITQYQRVTSSLPVAPKADTSNVIKLF